MIASNNQTAFTYPPAPLVRRHGPQGYQDYHSYRPWLRDENTFRCVGCLIREQWGRVSGEFDLDHFIPQVIDPGRIFEYENLVYFCHTCNLRRGKRAIPDPLLVLTSENVLIYPSGVMTGLTNEVKRIIRVLCLNSPKYIQWRRMWIRIVQIAQEHDDTLYRQLMAYPDDLPNLAKCKAPSNSKPESIEQSYYARRERGELADIYIY